MTSNLDALTGQQQAVWAAGDFNEIGRQNVTMAEALCGTVDPRPGSTVLDVACGSGTAALVAARRYCEVHGIDYVPGLVKRARVRAQASGLDATFEVGDAQHLPFPDDHFDVVLSVFGVQFAPHQTQAARELLRVCRPGGIIGLASPIPYGWTGDYFAVQSTYLPLPPDVPPASRWGTRSGLDELFGEGLTSLTTEVRTNIGQYRSVDHAVEVFSTYFGPTITALEKLPADEGAQLQAEITDVFDRHNRATDGTAAIETHYLETVGECR